jgi:hypothetical protein
MLEKNLELLNQLFAVVVYKCALKARVFALAALLT